MRERRGPWRQVSQCEECGWISRKETKWMDGFFVPVCPRCGAYNSSSRFSGIFRARTAREVRTRWLGRFIRWEFLDGEEV